MQAQIGICNVERELDIEIEDPDTFTTQLEEAFQSGTHMLWYQDDKGRRVGLPIDKIAYVRIDTTEMELRVGFG